MTFKKTLAVATCVAAVASVASAAMAQTPPAAAPRPAAAAPAQQIRHGAPIPGVCVYSSERAFAQSEVGKYVQTRVKQLATEANAELTNERTGVQNDAKALDAARPTLTQDVFEQRAAALQVRANALQRKAELRQREVEVTERKAFMRVLQELDPIVVGIYQQRNCALLLGDGVLLGNEQMDLTGGAVTALNAKLKTFPFNRERLDTPQQAPGTVTAPATPPKK
ncbi:MAG: OmpH family outer membrane protein [Caulobacter sp.]|jgi:Skp family chaperone for outer membrane proteins|nr:OmpH family outer membrane protein [Caulobacter sp.]